MKTNYTFQKLSKISKKFPNLIAVRELTKEYTYKSFLDMALNISNQILLKKKNPIIAIIGEKDILSYVSIGVLKSGGTYVPISSQLPKKRIFKIISWQKLT